jgi:sugar fermentation stimulation protein A
VRFETSLISGRFLRRHKRFLAEVELPGEQRIWAHVPNTGALTGCLAPGQEVLLTHDARPGRKTSHTWRFCKSHEHWVCVDTLAPNRLVAEALAGPGLPGLPPVISFRSEVALPQGGRLDFVADLGDRQLFMEVKSITWVEDGVALFPDGVTARGRRHLGVLANLAAQGHEAWQVFVVQRRRRGPLPSGSRGGPGLCPGISAGGRGRCEYPGSSRKRWPPRKLPLPTPCLLIYINFSSTFASSSTNT